MTDTQVTPWTKGSNPDLPGPYQVQAEAGCGQAPYDCPDTEVGYQYWTGEFWGGFAPDIPLAELLKDKPSAFQTPSWRGLTSGE
jgi:hypothetical protein